MKMEMWQRRRPLKEVVLVVLVEEGMVVVEGLGEEEYPFITELAEVLMELEEGILEEVDMEWGLEGVVGDMVEWEDQGISSSMEL